MVYFWTRLPPSGHADSSHVEGRGAVGDGERRSVTRLVDLSTPKTQPAMKRAHLNLLQLPGRGETRNAKPEIRGKSEIRIVAEPQSAGLARLGFALFAGAGTARPPAARSQRGRSVPTPTEARAKSADCDCAQYSSDAQPVPQREVWPAPDQRVGGRRMPNNSAIPPMNSVAAPGSGITTSETVSSRVPQGPPSRLVNCNR